MTGRTARTAAIAALLTLIVLALGGLAFIYSGAYNVAASQDHTPLGRWLLGTVQERSVAAPADEVPEPPAFDSALVSHGFDHFRSMCVVCHGAPGVERGEVGKGLTPTPPELSEEAGELTTRELFWITRHGIKMAGMPAFGTTHSDDEIWGIVAFLQELDGMTAEEYQRREFRATSGSGGGGEEASGGGEASGGHSHAPGAAAHEH